MRFVFVSGRPSLDLLGTRKWRRRTATEEELTEPARLAEWAVAAGLLDDPPEVTAAQLARAVGTRESLYRVLTGRMAGVRAEAADVALLNEVAAGPPLAPTLTPEGLVCRSGTVDQLLSTLCADAFDLIGSGTFSRVRECGHEECTRLFVDTSRGRNRRWCGMSECGNRAKAQAFRDRRRA